MFQVSDDKLLRQLFQGVNLPCGENGQKNHKTRLESSAISRFVLGELFERRNSFVDRGMG